VNKSPRVVRDVRLVIRHVWFWKDERNPGDVSPGRSEFITVKEEIPAGGSTSFIHNPSPPLPVRSDGHFKTEVNVIGFTEVGQ
jgi:hypothetical protein